MALVPDMFDTVRILVHPETEKSGHAGLVGVVYGVTTPSNTGVHVVGPNEEDVAIHVDFDERRDAAWFSPSLVEFVDYGAGTTVEIGGVTFRRNVAGDWIRETT